MEENRMLTDWDSNLFDCFEDTSTCCYGFWCGPCLACTVSGKFGENYCLPLCDMCTFNVISPAGLAMRAAMRNRYGIKGSLSKDITVACCCNWCSWCQMHRELKFRKQKPTVVNVQTQNIVSMQPGPVMIQGPSQVGFINPPGVITAPH